MYIIYGVLGLITLTTVLQILKNWKGVPENRRTYLIVWNLTTLSLPLLIFLYFYLHHIIYIASIGIVIASQGIMQLFFPKSYFDLVKTFQNNFELSKNIIGKLPFKIETDETIIIKIGGITFILLGIIWFITINLFVK